MRNDTRLAEAVEYTRRAMQRVAGTKPPPGQRFLPGARVKIADDLGPSMSHFPAGRTATVLHTYAHAYGGDDIASYALDVDGIGFTAWYNEGQLTGAARPRRKLAAAALVVLALAGCAELGQACQGYAQERDRILTLRATARALLMACSTDCDSITSDIARLGAALDALDLLCGGMPADGLATPLPDHLDSVREIRAEVDAVERSIKARGRS